MAVAISDSEEGELIHALGVYGARFGPKAKSRVIVGVHKLVRWLSSEEGGRGAFVFHAKNHRLEDDVVSRTFMKIDQTEPALGNRMAVAISDSEEGELIHALGVYGARFGPKAKSRVIVGVHKLVRWLSSEEGGRGAFVFHAKNHRLGDDVVSRTFMKIDQTEPDP